MKFSEVVQNTPTTLDVEFGPRLCRIETMEAAEATATEVRILPFQEPNKIELSNFD